MGKLATALRESGLTKFANCDFISLGGGRSGMHVISRKMLLKAVAKHPDLASPLDAWYRIAKQADWKSLADVRRTFPSADSVGVYTVFNIKGNAYRLIVELNYRTGRIFLRSVLTHAEYSKGEWKS